MHVGLAIDGVATIGAVALPGLDGGVVLRSDAPVALPEPAAIPRLLVSRTRPAALCRMRIARQDTSGGPSSYPNRLIASMVRCIAHITIKYKAKSIIRIIGPVCIGRTDISMLLY